MKASRAAAGSVRRMVVATEVVCPIAPIGAMVRPWRRSPLAGARVSATATACTPAAMRCQGRSVGRDIGGAPTILE